MLNESLHFRFKTNVSTPDASLLSVLISASTKVIAHVAFCPVHLSQGLATCSQHYELRTTVVHSLCKPANRAVQRTAGKAFVLRSDTQRVCMGEYFFFFRRIFLLIRNVTFFCLLLKCVYPIPGYYTAMLCFSSGVSIIVFRRAMILGCHDGHRAGS